MKSRFIWVDEEERIWALERKLLLGLGIDVEAIGDATSAYAAMQASDANAVRLLILDVMLLPGEDRKLFSDEDTRMGRATGLTLARRLCASYPQIGKRILFFSRATDRSDVAEIHSLVKEIGAFYLPKGPNTQGVHFISWLKENGFISGG